MGILSSVLESQIPKIEFVRYYQHSNNSSGKFSLEDLLESLVLDPDCRLTAYQGMKIIEVNPKYGSLEVDASRRAL
jgi:hypothetical protein